MAYVRSIIDVNIKVIKGGFDTLDVKKLSMNILHRINSKKVW